MTPAETVDRLRRQAWDRNVEPEHTMMLAAADVIASLMDDINRRRLVADQIKARSTSITNVDEKEMRRQMDRIATLADDIR